MPMIQQNYEHIGERYAALLAALTAAMATRVVTDELTHLSERKSADLEKGVITLVSDTESGYRNTPGMKAVEGNHKVIVIGHLKVAETDSRAAIQEKEFTLIEELKAFVRAGVPRMTINLQNVRGSRQLEHPYGWIYAELTLGPSDQGTH